MSGLALLTAFHTALSLVAIVAGIPVVAGLLGRPVAGWWTTLFLWTAIATSVTGFAFPFTGVLPSHIVGVVALAVLALALVARGGFHYAGAWRWIYAVAMVVSLYLLVFVGVAQAFLKAPPLHALAPTGSEPPFAIAQAVVLAAFVGLSILAARRFRPACGLGRTAVAG